MGRVYLCLGQNAELPYYFEKAKVHIWNIEELCYFIRENAWIMEPELLTKELIDWVAQQCGLPKLAVLLNDSLKEEDCVTAFAACLFSYTGYCPQEQALQVQKILQTNAGNSETDRAKARGDYFLESGKYFRALQEYEPLMKQLTGAKPEIVGSVYHNAGCAYAGLFCSIGRLPRMKKRGSFCGIKEARPDFWRQNGWDCLSRNMWIFWRKIQSCTRFRFWWRNS